MRALIHRRAAFFHRAVHKMVHSPVLLPHGSLISGLPQSAACGRGRLGVADVRDDCVKGL